MIRIARTAVGTAFDTMSFVVDTAFAVVNQAQSTAASLLGLGKSKASDAARHVGSTTRTAAVSAKSLACDAARKVDQAADTAVDKTVELSKNVADSVDEPDRRPYEERTVEELYGLAVERDIEGRSTMNKAELINALREARTDDSMIETAVDAVTDAIDDGVDRRPYDERTFQELYELAAERDINGRSTMNKSELIVALRADH